MQNSAQLRPTAVPSKLCVNNKGLNRSDETVNSTSATGNACALGYGADENAELSCPIRRPVDREKVYVHVFEMSAQCLRCPLRLKPLIATMSQRNSMCNAPHNDRVRQRLPANDRLPLITQIHTYFTAASLQ
ncbi:unnamed protein product [Toxocara canis]|uniref:Uncharacterized protein n=1 Tax=Toxocara canis TaxID=6265 RepID=A0A183UD44_TOXCA|nr:unnamed protein product [Toxocara canis]